MIINSANCMHNEKVCLKAKNPVGIRSFCTDVFVYRLVLSKTIYDVFAPTFSHQLFGVPFSPDVFVPKNFSTKVFRRWRLGARHFDPDTSWCQDVMTPGYLGSHIFLGHIHTSINLLIFCSVDILFTEKHIVFFFFQ